MDIPSLFMIPSAVSSGKVHSVFPNTTDADFDFNRDSSATRVNSQGLIETVGYFSSEKVSSIENSTSSPFNTFTDNGGGSYTCISTNTTYAGFRQPSSERFAVTSGQVYRVSFDYVLNSGSTFQFFIGDDAVGSSFSGSPITISASGSYSFDVTITTTNSEARFVSQTNQIVNFTISNISVKEIQGDRARLNYEIEGGLVNTKPSLLLEPQSTNLVTYSEDYTQSVWNKENITVTSNAVISPDGTKNASILTDTSTNGQHRITTSALFSADGNNRVFSIFVKKGTSRYCAINHVAGFTSSVNTVIFDFDTASYVATGTTAYIDEVFTPKHYGNGWYKIAFRSDISSSAYNRLSIGLSNGTSYTDASYAGTGATVFVWGGQVEQQSYCTSYIPTNGSTQTRAAETCNGAGTSSILPSVEGILYAEIQGLNNGTNQRWIAIGSGSNANRVSIHFNSTNNISCSVRGTSSARYDANFNIGSQTNNTKAAIRYKDSDYSFFVNGVKVDSQQSNSLNFNASLSELAFDSADGASYFYGKCKDIRVYNTKEMTDSEVDILLTKITS